MALGKRLINTGVAAAAACNTDSVQAFGADAAYSSNIALYQLDSDGGTTNNVPDTTTNNYNGTATNVTYASGHIGNAAVFNGSSSYIKLNNINSTNFTPEKYTLSIWFKTTTGDKSIFSTDAGGNPISTRIRLSLTSGGLLQYEPFYISNKILGTTVVNDGNWHHVCASTDSNGNTKLFLDGSLENSGTGGYVNFRNETWLGCTDNTAYSTINRTNFFDGQIDQVRIFNKAISAEDVATLYAETSSTASNTNPFSEGAGVALYTMDYDASEASGYYDGTPTDVTFGVGGAIGAYGARFNGSTSIINLSTYSAISQQNNFSLSFWLKPNGFAAYSAIVKFYSSYRNYVELGLNGILGFNATGSQVNTPSGSITDGDWQHVAITKSSTDGTVIYVNGVAVVTSSSDTGNAADFSSNSYTNYLGGWDGSQYGFSGDLDQVRIFSKALNQTEVDTLYAETACVYTSTTDNNDYPVTNLAYYKLDNSAEDEKGSYDGTETNIEYRFGRFGQAAVFNGSSSKIDTGINSFTNNLAFSMWLNPSSLSSSLYWVFSNWNSTSQDFYILVNSSGQLRINFDGSSGDVILGNSGDISVGNWHHIVVSMLNGTFTAYLNSVSLGGGTTTNTTFSNGQYFEIGSAPKSSSSISKWDGSIDQVRIFNSALSASNVTDLYNEKPEVDTSNFKAVLYEGNGGSQYISNVGFKPDFVWIKSRSTSSYWNTIFDTVRGPLKRIFTNESNAETTTANTLTSFDSNGFTLGNQAGQNANTETYVAWTWKAGGDAVSNTQGDITSDVSANTEAGFSIVKVNYGSGEYTQTVGHGLSQQPELIISKSTDSSSDWFTFSEYGGSLLGTNNILKLNTSAVATSDSLFDISTSTFKTGYSTGAYNAIAYCWHSVAGYSKIGSFVGAAIPNTQNIGFRPSFILLKCSSTSENWSIYDSERGTTQRLYPDLSASEHTYSSALINFTNNGFEFATTSNSHNGSGQTYIYMAFK